MKQGCILSHFTPDTNNQDKPESQCFEYAVNGTGMSRY
jgi:phosphoribulokinase